MILKGPGAWTLSDAWTACPAASKPPKPPDPSAFQLLCHATPLGLEADDEPPLPLELLRKDLFVGDVIAGVGETALMAAARAQGSGTADGDAMVTAVLDIMSDFLAGAWQSKDGGPTRT